MHYRDMGGLGRIADGTRTLCGRKATDFLPDQGDVCRSCDARWRTEPHRDKVRCGI